MAPEAESAGRYASSPKSAERAAASAEHDGESAADALRLAWARFAQLREYWGYFLAAKLDRLKLTIRQYVMLAVLGVLALLAGAAVIITAVVLLLDGIAGGIAAICGDRIWLGDLLCGVLVISVLAIGIRIVFSRMTKLSRESTVNKYEHDQRKEHVSHAQNGVADASESVGTGTL